MKLLIAIPALNEEASIADVIQRCLDARDVIAASTPITAVDVTVVSDGSTDATVERASAFGDRVRVIVFERNRGYGAAIMEAWRQSDAELLAFLDADGTCDPAFFAELCRALIAQDAHIALGSRMHRNSQMPLVRRAGNFIFATMLTAFGTERVRDSASGMRVVRRDCLPRLMPLPTGLHFTPAMSARAILADDLRIIEVDMPYSERAGRSKLNPIKDGVRFLRVILTAAFLYRPSRPLRILGWICTAFAAFWALRLVWQLSQFHRWEQWMIYHFVVVQLSATAAVLLFTAGHLADKAVGAVLTGSARSRDAIGRLLAHRWFWLLPLALIAVGTIAIGSATIDYLRDGRIDTESHHWSRFFTMSFAYSCAFILAITRLVDITLDLLIDRVAYLREHFTA
ncbi:MAG TPA: glycosyltransferase family 2 protein [Vicinamibacterales bacterium]|nr:glycosyltransferase family 2 protein [Vicinamibacterales bacterium]